MSGEHLRDDDDFLDDDFVLEDDGAVGDVPQEEVPPPMAAAVPPAPIADEHAPLAAADIPVEDDLDALFGPLPVDTAAAIVELDADLAGSGDPAAEAAVDDLFAIAEPDAAALAEAGAPEPAAAEDVLFEVPEQEPEAVFEPPQAFDVRGGAGWQAEELAVDDSQAFAPAMDLGDEMPHADAVPASLRPEDVEAVTREFELELESLDAVLEDDEDLVVDSEQDLELVDAPPTDFVDASATDFVEEPAAEYADAEFADAEFADAEFADAQDADGASTDELPTLEPWDGDDAGFEDAVADPAWAPLDPAAEVVEEPTENPYAEEYYAQEHELADRAGEELYVEEEPVAELAPVIGGPRPARRWMPILMSAAASLAILTSGAVVVARPEWFGLSLAPERVPAAQVERPTVASPVNAPLLPPLPNAEPTPVATESVAAVPAAPASLPEPVAPSVEAEANAAAPATVPATAPEAAPPTETVVAATPEPQPEAGAVNSTAPESVAVVLPVPVAQASRAAEFGTESLVRVSDHLLVGGSIELPPAKPSLPDGLTLGSRAFAQLRNGNYFVGSVKRIEEASLTLLVGEGEVSLPNDSIVRLTKLGAGDYEALMKVTEGSVRLTNSNKLVGSIIRDIADDHVVLEFRSNRVVLPKSAVDDIVEGAASGGVRLGTTAQEESWLREIAERELGTGLAPTESPKAAGATSAAPTPAAQQAPVPPLPAFPAPKR